MSCRDASNLALVANETFVAVKPSSRSKIYHAGQNDYLPVFFLWRPVYRLGKKIQEPFFP